MLTKSLAIGVIAAAMLVGCDKDNGTTAPAEPKTDAQVDANQAKLDAKSAGENAADATRNAADATKNAAIAATRPSNNPTTAP